MLGSHRPRSERPRHYWTSATESVPAWVCRLSPTAQGALWPRPGGALQDLVIVRLARRDTALTGLLLERRWIKPAQRDQLHRDVGRLPHKHQGDARASIRAGAEVNEAVRQSLGHVFREPPS